MGTLLIVILLLAVGIWIGKEFADARRRQALPVTRAAGGRPPPPPHQRVDDQALQRHVDKLREAVERGHVSLDEAAGSLVRLTGGGLSASAARDRLQRP